MFTYFSVFKNIIIWSLQVNVNGDNSLQTIWVAGSSGWKHTCFMSKKTLLLLLEARRFVMRWFEEPCYTLGMSTSCPDLFCHLTLGDFWTRQGHSGFSLIRISRLGGLLLKRKRMRKQITQKGLQGNLVAWSSNEKMPAFFVTPVRPEIVFASCQLRGLGLLCMFVNSGLLC